MDKEKEEWTWERHVAYAHGKNWGEEQKAAEIRDKKVTLIGLAIILSAPFIAWLIPLLMNNSPCN